MVAQVDEQQLAMIALLVDPSGQTDFGAHVGFAQGAAVMGTIGVHKVSPVSALASNAWLLFSMRPLTQAQQAFVKARVAL